LISSAALKNLQQENGADLLPLDAPLVVCTGKYRHIFGRLEALHWQAYFTGHGVNAEGLYRRAILRIDGLGLDSQELKELPTCSEYVPLEDRLSAVDLLLKIFWTFALDSFSIDEEGRRVSFEIASGEGKPGPLCRYFSLIHHFRAPTIEQRERFLLSGISGADQIESRFAVLLRTYDELILCSEGYSIAGRPIASAHLRREMDAFHKAVAVGFLLDPQASCFSGGLAVAAAPDAVGPKTAAAMVRSEGVH
jgi:hypothetical protein